MMVGKVMKFGRKIVISGRIVDVERGVAESSAKQVAHSKEGLIDAASKFIKKITGSIDTDNEILLVDDTDPYTETDNSTDDDDPSSEEDSSYDSSTGGRPPLLQIPHAI